MQEGVSNLIWCIKVTSFFLYWPSWICHKVNCLIFYWTFQIWNNTIGFLWITFAIQSTDISSWPGSDWRLLPELGASGAKAMKVQNRSLPRYWHILNLFYNIYWMYGKQCALCANKTVFKDSLTFRVLMAMIWRTPWGDEDLDYRREEILNTPKQPPQSFLKSPSESFYNFNACDHLRGEKSIPKGDRVSFRDMSWKARPKPVVLYFFICSFRLGSSL